MPRKPVVNKDRLYTIKILSEDLLVALDEEPLSKVQSIIDSQVTESISGIGLEPKSEVYLSTVEEDDYGGCIWVLHAVQEFYTETEEEWATRVEKENQKLEEWKWEEKEHIHEEESKHAKRKSLVDQINKLEKELREL